MSGLTMKLEKDIFAVCRLHPSAAIPGWVNKTLFTSITRTEDELSIVCEMKQVPEEIQCEKDWRILKVVGPLDFALVGILANISRVLAEASISIFAISTYDTDYILVKEKDLDAAISALSLDNHIIIQ